MGCVSQYTVNFVTIVMGTNYVTGGKPHEDILRILVESLESNVRKRSITIYWVVLVAICNRQSMLRMRVATYLLHHIETHRIKLRSR